MFSGSFFPESISLKIGYVCLIVFSRLQKKREQGTMEAFGGVPYGKSKVWGSHDSLETLGPRKLVGKCRVLSSSEASVSV